MYYEPGNWGKLTRLVGFMCVAVYICIGACLLVDCVGSSYTDYIPLVFLSL